MACDERLGIPLWPELKDKLEDLAHRDGLHLRAYIRQILNLHVFGAASTVDQDETATPETARSGAELESRSAHSTPWGKCTEIIGVPVSLELKEATVALACLKGQPAAEYARDVVATHVLGRLAMMRAYARDEVRAR